MQIHKLTQGSPEWLAYRREHDNASDAPAMMGVSSYKTRDELIAERAIGITREHDAATLKRFADGHRFEALARPLAEEIIGEDLYPVTGSSGRLSASFDGLTMVENIAFEHKGLKAALREVLSKPDCTGAELPLEYQIQMEQQLAVADPCERVLFMASKWDDDNNLIEALHCWYYPNLTLRAQILAGWEQFHKDVAAYVAPAPRATPVVADTMESLPAVSVRLDGKLAVISNLPDFATALRAFIERIPAKPETDQDFANAEAACKALKRSEDALTAGEDAALGEMVDFEAMRRQVRDLKELARTTRLATEKLVAARKEQLRGEIVAGGVAAYRTHVDSLNASLGKPYMPNLPVDFGGAVKNKRTIDSLRGAVNDELARAKIAANEVAQQIQTNLNTLRDHAGAHAFLFADTAALVLKEPEFVGLTVGVRIAEHEKAEAARLEREREAIRAQEAARVEREHAAKVEAERKAKAEAEAVASAAEAKAKADAEAAALALNFVAPGDDRFGVVAIPHDLPIGAALALEARSDSDPARGLSDGIFTGFAVPSAPYQTAIGCAATVGTGIVRMDTTGQATHVPPAEYLDDGARVNLTAINEHFAPIQLTAAGLATLGFEAVATVKASKQYRQCDLPAMASALISHLHALSAKTTQPA